jgi:hypothetical protein
MKCLELRFKTLQNGGGSINNQLSSAWANLMIIFNIMFLLKYPELSKRCCCLPTVLDVGLVLNWQRIPDQTVLENATVGTRWSSSYSETTTAP